MPATLIARSIAKTAAGMAALWGYRPLRDSWRRLVGTHPVRVFTFHRITDRCRDGMTVSPATFREQVEYVRRHHEVVSIERALDLLASGKRLRAPIAVLTFDDAYRSVYDVARPLLAELGLPACCFASTGLVGTDQRYAHDAENPAVAELAVLTWVELRRLREQGWAIGGHGVHHERFSDLPAEQLQSVLLGSLQALRECLEVKRPPLAYPFGGPADCTAAGRALARACGYRACFSDCGGENAPGADLFDLKRIDIGAEHARIAWHCMAHGIELRQVRRWWRRRPDAAELEHGA